MRTAFQTWFHNVPFIDPLVRRQALLLQGAMVVILAAVVPSIPLSLLRGGWGAGLLVRVSGIGLLALGIAASLFVLRRGHLQIAILGVVFALATVQTTSFIGIGLAQSSLLFFIPAISLTLTGLLSTRRVMLFTLGLNTTLILMLMILEQQGSALIGFEPVVDSWSRSISTVVGFFMIGLIIIFLLDQFARAFRENLALARQREQELDQLQHQQATIIAERTQELEQALQTSQQQHQQLQSTVDAPPCQPNHHPILDGSADSNSARCRSCAAHRSI